MIEQDIWWLIRFAAVLLVGRRVCVDPPASRYDPREHGEGVVTGASYGTVTIQRDDGTTFDAKVTDTELLT